MSLFLPLLWDKNVLAAVQNVFPATYTLRTISDKKVLFQFCSSNQAHLKAVLFDVCINFFKAENLTFVFPSNSTYYVYLKYDVIWCCVQWVLQKNFSLLEKLDFRSNKRFFEKKQQKLVTEKKVSRTFHVSKEEHILKQITTFTNYNRKHPTWEVKLRINSEHRGATIKRFCHKAILHNCSCSALAIKNLKVTY